MKFLHFIRSHIAFVLCAFIISLSASAQSGTLTYLRTDYNKIINGQKWCTFHFKVNVIGLKGKEIKVIIYIEHPKGTGVPDLNGSYKTYDGKVSANGTGTPGYDDTIYNDFVVNIPNSEIHPLPGENTYYVEALLWYGDKVLDRTYCDTFTMSGPSKSPARNSGSSGVYYTPPVSNSYPCGVCGGTGRCSNCGGSGISPNHAPGIRANCGACGGTGICATCRGRGSH